MLVLPSVQFPLEQAPDRCESYCNTGIRDMIRAGHCFQSFSWESTSVVFGMSCGCGLDLRGRQMLSSLGRIAVEAV